MNTLKVIKELCIGCNIYEMVCSLFHTKSVNPARARLKVVTGDNDNCYPVVCRQCQKPKCLPVCPTEAIYKDQKTGAVMINHEKWNNCLACVSACPYQEIFAGPNNEILKCDLCGGDPKCVKYCFPRPPKIFPHLPETEQSCLQYVKNTPAQ